MDFVDNGFVLCVMASRGYLMFGQRRPVVPPLEGALRQLLEEATIASENLNRSLLKRKDEIQRLLAELEFKQQQLGAGSAPQSENLPNSSWEAPVRPAARPIPQQYASNQASTRAEPDLRQLVENSADQVTLTARAKPRAAAARTNANLRSDLAKRIEVLRSQKQMQEESPEIAAQRIAERLLRSGQEIHIVARKLELPLERVREIDRAMRGPVSTATDEFLPLEQATEPVEIIGTDGQAIERQSQYV